VQGIVTGAFGFGFVGFVGGIHECLRDDGAPEAGFVIGEGTGISRSGQESEGPL